jgi:hypothetical protein
LVVQFLICDDYLTHADKAEKSQEMLDFKGFCVRRDNAMLKVAPLLPALRPGNHAAILAKIDSCLCQCIHHGGYGAALPLPMLLMDGAKRRSGHCCAIATSGL